MQFQIYSMVCILEDERNIEKGLEDIYVCATLRN